MCHTQTMIIDPTNLTHVCYVVFTRNLAYPSVCTLRNHRPLLGARGVQTYITPMNNYTNNGYRTVYSSSSKYRQNTLHIWKERRYVHVYIQWCPFLDTPKRIHKSLKIGVSFEIPSPYSRDLWISFSLAVKFNIDHGDNML